MGDASAGERIAAVTSGIKRAARLARRDPGEIRLIAVSKGQPTEAILPLIRAGQIDFGESKVQEAQRKWPSLLKGDLVLHLVGRLQSNKARAAVGLFDVIHSVDRAGLVDALADAMARERRRPDCFIQVNLGDEPQKGGCTVSELPRLVKRCAEAELPLVGLMCVPPMDLEPAPWFALLAKLARRDRLEGLSMGMSVGYETAVMIGATHVRVGTALFGERV